VCQKKYHHGRYNRNVYSEFVKSRNISHFKSRTFYYVESVSYLKINHVSETRTAEVSALNTANVYCLLSSSMGQNISWEDSGYLGIQLFHVTCNLSCHYRVQNVPPLVCILCPILAVRTILLCLMKIYFHFFLLLMSRFSSSVFRQVIPIENLLLISSVYHAFLVARTVSYIFLS